MREFDIIIAGGGPAGLSAAAELGKTRGLKVLLVEKTAILSTDKTWAGFTGDFRRRGLMAAVSRRVRKAGFGTFRIGVDIRKVDFSVLDQVAFLNLLYSRVGKNVSVKENCSFLSFSRSEGLIKVNTTKGGFRCKVLIDTSGFRTPVTRRYSLQDDVFVWQCIAYEIERTSPKSLNEILWDMPFDKKPEVDFWIDLLAGNKCSVGLMHLTKAGSLLPKKEIKRLLGKYLKLRGIAGKRTAVRQGIIAMNEFRQLSFDNILLAGNSASQAAPDTGYGLIPALDNGALAAKVAAEAVEKGRYGREFLMKYDSLWSRKYKLRYRFNRILQLAHYHLSPGDVSRMVESFKGSTRWLVKKTKSSLSYDEMDWFFSQMNANFPVASALRKLPLPAILGIAREIALLKAGIYAEKLMPGIDGNNL